MIPCLTFTLNHLLDINQPDSRRGCSVETNILCFYNSLIKSMESGKQIDVIIIFFHLHAHSMLLTHLHDYTSGGS